MLKIKKYKASWRGFWLYNLPQVDQFLSDKNTPCYSLLEDCFFNGKKNIYYNKPSMFFCEKIYIQIHIQTCLYTYMRINIYSNNIRVPSMFPLERAKMVGCMYIQRHILQLQMTMQEIHHPRDNHALFYAPPLPGITSAVV